MVSSSSGVPKTVVATSRTLSYLLADWRCNSSMSSSSVGAAVKAAEATEMLASDSGSSQLKDVHPNAPSPMPSFRGSVISHSACSAWRCSDVLQRISRNRSQYYWDISEAKSSKGE